MTRILTVLGARPQFIKASVVSRALAECGLREVLLHTGQHFDANMSDVFFEELGMAAPSHFLGIHGGLHGEMTGRMLIEVERLLVAERPDAVLVYGDTNSTLAGALAAAKLNIPVAHVEAGLRSFNPRMPEEINRILTDRVARWLFTPTTAASAHLIREGVGRESIFEVGDVMYDAVVHHGLRSETESRALGSLGLSPGAFALATVHRAENTDDIGRLGAVIGGLAALAEALPVVWPMHPRTRLVLERQPDLRAMAARLRLIEPQGYLDMMQLERHAALIATDSGGVQKEAFFHRVPCVTLRDVTEWTELVDTGWNRLAPPGDPHAVGAALRAALGTKGTDVQPYGKGDAARLIAERLRRDLE